MIALAIAFVWRRWSWILEYLTGSSSSSCEQEGAVVAMPKWMDSRIKNVQLWINDRWTGATAAAAAAAGNKGNKARYGPLAMEEDEDEDEDEESSTMSSSMMGRGGGSRMKQKKMKKKMMDIELGELKERDGDGDGDGDEGRRLLIGGAEGKGTATGVTKTLVKKGATVSYGFVHIFLRILSFFFCILSKKKLFFSLLDMI